MVNRIGFEQMIEPKIDISPLLVPRRKAPIIPTELKKKYDPDLDKGLEIFSKKQFRFEYYQKHEIEKGLLDAGFVNLKFHHRHGYSWTVVGENI